MEQEIDNEKIYELLRSWHDDIFIFVKDMWGLVPQPLKPEYEHLKWELPADKFRADMFQSFIKGQHLTWQQFLFFRAVLFASQGKDKKRIAVESGHGTGKSMSLSLIILWYLTCHPDAQIPCTAPTDALMKDILWKELEKWLQKMPEEYRGEYVVVEGYLRMKESPKTWFARARTATKDNPEALAGVHGDFVMFVIDEASGVIEKVFEVAEGALTDVNILVIMTSNHTRTTGYFHAAFNEDKEAWQRLSFDSRESPIVDWGYVQRIIDKYGEDSDVYRVRVAGKSPREDAIDGKGYVPLLNVGDIHWSLDDSLLSGGRRLGVDPSGEGDDETKWVLRDGFKARVIATEKSSTPKSIAQKTASLMELFEVEDYNVIVDSFGEGADVFGELAILGHRVTPINVGKKCSHYDNSLQGKEDDTVYLNLRAKGFWKLREWAKKGGEFVRNDGFSELTNIKYRRTTGTNSVIQIMPKEDMKKEGIKSPNTADALMLTFAVDPIPWEEAEEEEVADEPMKPRYNEIGI